MKKLIKVYELLYKVNTVFLVLAAICVVKGLLLGNYLFVYASIIGLVDGLKEKNVNSIVINSTFIAMNLFFIFS